MIYKIISYKHFKNGEVIDVNFSDVQDIDTKKYDIEYCNYSDLNDNEKDMLMEHICDALTTLTESLNNKV